MGGRVGGWVGGRVVNMIMFCSLVTPNISLSLFDYFRQKKFITSELINQTNE